MAEGYGRIIALPRRAGGAPRPRLQEVRGYWEALRAGAALPRRADLNPRGMERVLEHVFLLERVAPGVARFRLAGQTLHGAMGMDVTGMPISALIEPESREAMAKALERVFAEPAILTGDLVALRGIGRPALDGALLLLPLLGDSGRSDRALGCIDLEGSPGRAPRRFQARGLSVSPVAARRDETAQSQAPPPPVSPMRDGSSKAARRCWCLTAGVADRAELPRPYCEAA
ncbi:MAG: PAS domain-containing protein [Paracoccaceae bacterium]